MKRWLLLLWVAALFPGVGRGDDALPAVAVVDEEGFVAVADSKGPQLRVAIWPDGRIIWESNPGRFMSGKAEPSRVQALLDRFEKEKVFEEDSFRHSWRVPDGGVTVIWLSSGTRQTRLEVWREDEKDTDEKYQKFYRVWKDLRADIVALTPKEGTLYTGSTVLRLPHLGLR